MRSRLASASAFLLLAVAWTGCARTWPEPDLRSAATGVQPVDPEACGNCHEDEHAAWRRTDHASTRRMDRIPEVNLRGCVVCHAVQPAHPEAPSKENVTSPATLAKTAQNDLCGKCHYSRSIFGCSAINPRDRHGLLTSTGLEGRKKQLSCLDCHSGHKGKGAMLKHARSVQCYQCHKTAMATMGIFQPLNWITFGKTCQACHTIHGGSDAAKAAKLGTGFCVVCHFAGTAIAGD